MSRFPNDGAGSEHQQKAIDEGGEDRGLAEPVGAMLAAGPARQPGGAAGQGQAQNVRQVVARVGEQGGGVGEIASDGFRQHKGQIEPDP